MFSANLEAHFEQLVLQCTGECMQLCQVMKPRYLEFAN